jgi:hypothetical protein
MTPENRKRIQEAAGKAGDELKGKLPPLPDHPDRNSYAHVWREIKQKFNVASYKECDDTQVEEILALIEETRLNPR